jgi:hypothetical protein
MAKRNFNVEPFDQDSDEDRYIATCAKIRNISLHALVKRLLKVIAKDQMVAAILDDTNHLQEREPGEKRFRRDARKSYGAKEYPL